MKILVTGGCGFIGSHVVDAYINEGHQVVIIDDLSTGDIKNLNSKAKFFKEDIRNKNIEDIFRKENFDIVNHHAAQINVRISVTNPLFDAQINILGSLNLLNQSVKYGVKRFIFASSGGAVYGEPEKFPITENFALDPLSPYAVSKIATEKYLLTLTKLYDFDYVILRYSNVYGPRQISKSEAGVISIFINQILNNTECVVFGDGNQVRDYVYVDDVVEANILALDCKSDILNIGTGIATSVNDLINILSDITKKSVDHRHDKPRPGDVFKNVLDYSKAESKLHWKPKMSLNQGILKTFEYFSIRNAGTQKVS
jgi:UDP-glucose 4-epimerase